MSQYSIAVVIGSLRRDSFNRQLAEAVAKLVPSDFSFNYVKVDDLPPTIKPTTGIKPRL